MVKDIDEKWKIKVNKLGPQNILSTLLQWCPSQKLCSLMQLHTNWVGKLLNKKGRYWLFHLPCYQVSVVSRELEKNCTPGTISGLARLWGQHVKFHMSFHRTFPHCHNFSFSHLPFICSYHLSIYFFCFSPAYFYVSIFTTGMGIWYLPIWTLSPWYLNALGITKNKYFHFLVLSIWVLSSLPQGQWMLNAV